MICILLCLSTTLAPAQYPDTNNEIMAPIFSSRMHTLERFNLKCSCIDESSLT